MEKFYHVTSKSHTKNYKNKSCPQLSIQRNGNFATLSLYSLKLCCFVKAIVEAAKRRKQKLKIQMEILKQLKIKDVRYGRH